MSTTTPFSLSLPVLDLIAALVAIVTETMDFAPGQHYDSDSYLPTKLVEQAQAALAAFGAHVKPYNASQAAPTTVIWHTVPARGMGANYHWIEGLSTKRQLFHVSPQEAAMIAAAPNLLAALQALLAETEGCYCTTEQGARAAIAKATGSAA